MNRWAVPLGKGRSEGTFKENVVFGAEHPYHVFSAFTWF